MPTFEYECECGNLFEVFILPDEKYEPQCPECLSKNVNKQISACHFGFGQTRAHSKMDERIKHQKDIKQDLLTNYGITNISPIKGVPNRDPKAATVEGVYKEIKQMGSYAKEKMQERYQITDQEQKEKGKKWRQERLATAAQRRKENPSPGNSPTKK